MPLLLGSPLKVLSALSALSTALQHINKYALTSSN